MAKTALFNMLVTIDMEAGFAPGELWNGLSRRLRAKLTVVQLAGFPENAFQKM